MTQQLEKTAQALVADGKGILAADESSGTIKKRFDRINTESTKESRRDYREMLFSSTEAMKNYISGVILFDETLRQSSRDGAPLVNLISDAGAITGIKVDKGAKPLAGAAGETVTEGLDGLRERFSEYFELGARFAKWRAVITISDGIPSRYCLKTNADALARYASLAQEAGIVPIVEPEVIMDGSHTVERCFSVTEAALKELYNSLFEQRVVLEGTILKPNMVVSGTECQTQAVIDQVAELTIKCLKRTVPAAVPGICFLSGGQSDEDATAHLSAMNSGFDLPWKLSFSYGRALQQAALKAWSGKQANWTTAQKAFAHRAKMNGLAALGKWQDELEKAA